MQVWAVNYKPELFSEDLFQRALLLVDDDSRTRIKRFYHRQDACRTLIGRLLVRDLLTQHGVPGTNMRFEVTATGKPYIAAPKLDPPIAYNVAHDNGFVAMVYAPGVHGGPAFNIGIDIMKLRVPGRDTLSSFIKGVGDQLTPLENYLLSSDLPHEERIKRFFWMWTLKEAYTKALGIGLGFDFSRVEFDVASKIVRVDGRIPEGWRFNMFVLNDDEDVYEGVVAEFVGGTHTEVIDETIPPNWLTRYHAVDFVTKIL